MITDRDIAVRAIAKGLTADTPVSLIMSNKICYCFDDQDLAEVADNMARIQVRRLPVMNRDKRLVGIVSIADLARAKIGKGAVEIAVKGISRTGGSRSQARFQHL